MGWLYILISGCGEIIFIAGLKQKNRKIAIALIVASSVLVGVFLNRALMLLDSSIVYPVFVSMGSFGSLLLGALFYAEHLNKKQIQFLVLLFTGCLGLFIGSS